MSAVLQPLPVPWQQRVTEQDGVLSRRQALLGGLTEEQWQWRRSSGRWQSLLPGVVVTHTGPPTGRQLAWAAVLGCGPGAHLSGDAALAELGMRSLAPAALDVAVPAGRVVAQQRLGERPVVPRRVSRLDVWRHRGRQLPVLRLPVALLHAASWAPSDRAAEWRLAAGVQQRLVRVADLRAALDDMPSLARRALVRTVLDDVELGAHAASELAFLRFLRQQRLPAPDRLQRPVRRGGMRYLDAWWERQRVAAELDGAHHRSVGVWDQDVLRSNELAVGGRRDGFLLLRFTTGNLRHDGPRVAAQLRAALR